MFFQTSLEDIALAVRDIQWIFISTIIFLIGVFLIRWFVRKKQKVQKKVWDTSFKSAAIINLVWLMINIPVRIIFQIYIGEKLILEFFNTSLNIIIGTFVIMIIHRKGFLESLLFIGATQIILFIIVLTLYLIFSLIYIPPYIFLYAVIEGLPSTLILTVFGLLFGLLIGITLAIMRVYGSTELRWLGIGYEKLFRGIPILVLIFLFYFSIPNISELNSVILALAVRSGAYQSQIFRGAILSVNPGQMEAAYSIGMTRLKAFRHILMPQALRIAVPSWSNEYAVVIKDTSFAFEIGVIEMTRAAYYVSVTNRSLWAIVYVVVAINYFLLTFPFTKLFGERQTNKLKKLGMGGG